MAIYASELSALQQSSLSMSGGGSGRLDSAIPAQGIINSQVQAADAAMFTEALSGTVATGQLDQTVQEQLQKMRQVMGIGTDASKQAHFSDQVMSGIKNVQEKLDGNLARIEGQIIQHIQVGALDPGQLVALQFKVAMFSFELEMANGIVHKSGQHVDTFLRSQ